MVGASEWEEEADSLLSGRERVLGGYSFWETNRGICRRQKGRILMDMVRVWSL
jgi:hypothetical protein